jgi:hypothetical protein
MSNRSSNVMTSMTALALPGNSDTFFTQLAGENNAVQHNSEYEVDGKYI